MQRPGTDDHAAWVERDAAVVWHGFTQMSSYADNSPIIIERAEGRELIDVDGRRYLDAISSLWVVTLGHHIAELDDALRAQIDRVAHSTMLGNGNRTTIELAEALAAVVPVDEPHFLFASDGAAAVEQALKIAFQFWTNQGITADAPRISRSAARITVTPSGRCRSATAASARPCSIRCGSRFGACRAAIPTPRSPRSSNTPASSPRLCSSRSCRAPRACCSTSLRSCGPSPTRAPGTTCCSCATKSRPASVAPARLFAVEQCGVRPDLLCLGKGLTGGYLAMAATVASGRVYDAFLGPDLSEQTLYHGHSYSGNALAAAVALRHLQLIDEWKVLDNVQARSAELRSLLRSDVAPLAGVKEIRQHGLMTGIELAPPADGLRWGRRVSAACVRRGVLIRPLGDVIVLMPPLTITAGEIERIVDTVRAAIEEVCAP